MMYVCAGDVKRPSVTASSQQSKRSSEVTLKKSLGDCNGSVVGRSLVNGHEDAVRKSLRSSVLSSLSRRQRSRLRVTASKRMSCHY